MLFEVKKNGKVMGSYTTKESIPCARIRNQMKEAGYKLFLNGKPYKRGDLK